MNNKIHCVISPSIKSNPEFTSFFINHRLLHSETPKNSDKPMVIEPEAKITMTDWSSQTNWTVSAGSLKDCITFESSLSSLNDGGDEAGATTVDSKPKSPLILHPSSSDSGPCEIKSKH